MAASIGGRGPCPPDEPQLPLGGVKDSGWGRSGPRSMADFTELRWITAREGTGGYPI
jgi:vanillin dehydrogenase